MTLCPHRFVSQVRKEHAHNTAEDAKILFVTRTSHPAPTLVFEHSSCFEFNRSREYCWNENIN
jgi:hypothetical protein